MELSDRRLKESFSRINNEKRNGLIAFITAGDPNLETSQKILEGLPKAGADIIEIGMPFTDPMADGPIIQASYQRALASGQNLKLTLKMVKKFRENNKNTPIILMGYYNPIFQMGIEVFLEDCLKSGVDGLIIVDLPYESDEKFFISCKEKKINFIRLITPTTSKSRLKNLLGRSSGFIYYISVAGITGSFSAPISEIKSTIMNIKNNTTLPVAVGFGIRNKDQVKSINKFADAAVVGSAIVSRIEYAVLNNKDPIKESLDFVNQLTVNSN